MAARVYGNGDVLTPCAGLTAKPEDLDWSQLETTADQLGIEDVLGKLLQSCILAPSIFHAGIGNSSLARRFWRRTKRIVGCTISRNEATHGASLDIPNYKIVLGNKYEPNTYFWADAEFPQFGFIVDNNPVGFACCWAHARMMWQCYIKMLEPGGMILTHRDGMAWSVDGGMKQAFEDLVKLEALFPVKAEELTEKVCALRRIE